MLRKLHDKAEVYLWLVSSFRASLYQICYVGTITRVQERGVLDILEFINYFKRYF